MLAALRAELLVLRRRRAAWALVLITPVLTWITFYLVPYVQYRTVTPDQYAFYGTPDQLLPTLLPEQFVIAAVGLLGFQGAAPFAVLGALTAGGAWATGTLSTALLQRPGRVATLVGQSGALLIAATVAVVTTFAVSGVTSVLVALAETGSVSPDLGPLPAPTVVARAIGVGVLVACTSCAAGQLLGTLLRNPGGAVAAVLLWTVFGQTLLDNLGLQVGGVMAVLNNALPNASVVSVTSIFGSLGGGPNTAMYFRVEPVQATGILVGYVVAFVTVAALVVARRDVGVDGGGAYPRRRRPTSHLSHQPRHRPARSGSGLPAALRAEVLVAVRRPTIWALAAIPPLYVALSGYGLPYLFASTASSGVMGGFSPPLILPTLLPDHLAATVMGTLGLDPGLGFDATAPFLIVGGLLAGSAWERGTIRTALLQGPGRLATFAGQAVMMTAIVVASVGATFLLGVAASGLIAVAEAGSPFAPSGSGLYPAGGLVPGAVATAALIGVAYGAIGLALGTTFRNTSGPLAVTLIWAVVVQPELATLAGQTGGVLEAINHALPSGSVQALVHVFAPVGPLMSNPTGPLIDPLTAVGSLLAYAAVFLAGPALLVRRRDVT